MLLAAPTVSWIISAVKMLIHYNGGLVLRLKK